MSITTHNALRCAIGLTALLGAPLAGAAQREGCHIEEIVDEDGDLQIQMESEWINMHLQPSIGSTVVRFVFRPTNNDILDEIQPNHP